MILSEQLCIIEHLFSRFALLVEKGHVTILWFKSPYMHASTLEIRTTICRKQQ